MDELLKGFRISKIAFLFVMLFSLSEAMTTTMIWNPSGNAFPNASVFVSQAIPSVFFTNSSGNWTWCANLSGVIGCTNKNPSISRTPFDGVADTKAENFSYVRNTFYYTIDGAISNIPIADKNSC